MSTAPPKRQPIPFGKYLLLDRVNIGGMAEVWRAKTFGAGGFERVVAIKRILPNIAEDEEFITMFIDEAKITVQLNHANIAQVYELSHISNSYFIAMEYIGGRDMRAMFDRCRKRGEPAPIPLVCYVIAKSCEGLDYAHRNKDRAGRDMNIVHRDVSPQNLLISYDGEVKVIDFGIAKAAGKATKTQAGILKGKFGYMSPEQIRGLPLDRRSDVFAIGVCLYEMLTSERLFVGDSDFSVLEKVRKVEVLPPTHFNRKIPEALERIVMKALAKDVEDRYQYASELADDLQRFVVTQEVVFGREKLAAFMKATFAEEYEKEKARVQEYNEIKPPEGMLAAAQMGMGFGVGQVPSPVGQAPSPSAITNVPSVAAASVPAAGARPSLSSMPVIRPSSPNLPRPPSAPATTSPPARAQSIPRLTAVAPSKTTENEEHASTQMVDGSGVFDEATNPGAGLNGSGLKLGGASDNNGGELTALRGAGATTDPVRPSVTRPLGALTGEEAAHSDFGEDERTMMGQEATAFMPDGPPPSVPVPAPPPARVAPPPVLSTPTVSTKRPPAATGPLRPPPPTMERAEEFDNDPLPAPTAPPARTAPLPSSTASSLPTMPAVSPRSKVPMMLGILSLVLVGLIGVGAVIALRPKPTGMLFLNLPSDLSPAARVEVNGQQLLDESGKPMHTWPTTRSVPVGPVTVMVTAPGYKPYIKQVQVSEGNGYTEVGQGMEPEKAP